MKKKSREINIFSISALDLFASALGAFILITIILFPFFPNTGDSPERAAATRAELRQVKQQLEQARAMLAACRREAEHARNELQNCQEQLRRKFLLVVISWGRSDDVDLHVVDPAGREFYFDVPSHLGSLAKLEEDNINGPGNEIWLHPKTEPGNYKIYYNLYRRDSLSVTVRGGILTPEGKSNFRTRELSVQGYKQLIAIIRIDSQGNATVNEI